MKSVWKNTRVESTVYSSWFEFFGTYGRFFFHEENTCRNGPEKHNMHNITYIKPL